MLKKWMQITQLCIIIINVTKTVSALDGSPFQS